VLVGGLGPRRDVEVHCSSRSINRRVKLIINAINTRPI
jgi:hypothetical protein